MKKEHNKPRNILQEKDILQGLYTDKQIKLYLDPNYLVLKV